jgi:hypothetical protein
MCSPLGRVDIGVSGGVRSLNQKLGSEMPRMSALDHGHDIGGNKDVFFVEPVRATRNFIFVVDWDGREYVDLGQLQPDGSGDRMFIRASCATIIARPINDDQDEGPSLNEEPATGPSFRAKNHSKPICIELARKICNVEARRAENQRLGGETQNVSFIPPMMGGAQMER